MTVPAVSHRLRSPNWTF